MFLARGRKVLAIQLTTMVLALVLLAGTAWSYRRLINDAALLTPALQQMLVMSQTREQERHNLLLKMAQTGNVKMRSVFLPASLFSTLDDDITDVMAFACGKWVLANLHNSLLAKTNQLLAPPPPDGWETLLPWTPQTPTGR